MKGFVHTFIPEFPDAWAGCCLRTLAQLCVVCTGDAAFFQPLLASLRLAALLKQLGDPMAQSRGAAADALGEYKAFVDEATLVNTAVTLSQLAISDDDKYISYKAVRALRRLSRISARVASVLTKLLAEDDDDLRSWVEEALEDLGKRDRMAFEEAAQFMARGNLGVALLSLDCTPEAPSDLCSLPFLPILRNGESQTATLHSNGTPTSPQLGLEFCGDLCGIGARTAMALKRLNSNRCMDVPDLILLLDHCNKYVCYKVILALGDLGSAAKPALPHLKRMLEDTDPDIRMWTVEVLGKLGASTQDVAPELRPLLMDEDHDVRDVTRQLFDRLAVAY